MACLRYSMNKRNFNLIIFLFSLFVLLIVLSILLKWPKIELYYIFGNGIQSDLLALYNSSFNLFPDFISNYPVLTKYALIPYYALPGNFSNSTLLEIGALIFIIFYYFFLEKLSKQKLHGLKIFLIISLFTLHPGVSLALQIGPTAIIDLVLIAMIAIGFNQFYKGIFVHGLIFISFALAGLYLNSQIGIFYAATLFLMTPLLFKTKHDPDLGKHTISLYLVIFFPLFASILSVIYFNHFISNSYHFSLINMKSFNYPSRGEKELLTALGILFLSGIVLRVLNQRIISFVQFIIVSSIFLISSVLIIVFFDGPITSYTLITFSLSNLFFTIFDILSSKKKALFSIPYVLFILTLHWAIMLYFFPHLLNSIIIGTKGIQDQMWKIEALRPLVCFTAFYFIKILFSSRSRSHQESI